MAPCASDTPSPRDRILLTVNSIPVGRFSTYGRIATAAGLPNQARWVGHTLASLPAQSTIPWHRVMNASQKPSFPESDPRYQAQLDRLAAEA